MRIDKKRPEGLFRTTCNILGERILCQCLYDFLFIHHSKTKSKSRSLAGFDAIIRILNSKKDNIKHICSLETGYKTGKLMTDRMSKRAGLSLLPQQEKQRVRIVHRFDYIAFTNSPYQPRSK